jgi:hypothetical protein
MWDEPYLESCCRAALHRLWLAGGTGRPADVPDGACLRRLARLGLCESRADGRFGLTHAGAVRHGAEVLRAGRVADITTAAR